MSRFIKSIDCPIIPQGFLPPLSSLGTSIEPIFSTRNYTRTILRDNETLENWRFDKFGVSDDLTEWIHTNLTPDVENIGISCMATPNSIEPHYGLPHTDGTRGMLLTYLLDLGGDNVDTVFYKLKNSDELYFQTQIHPKSYDELEIIETYRLEKERWYLLNARAIHSVENMTSPRIALQMGLPLRSEFVKKYFTLDITDPEQYIHNMYKDV